MVWLAGRGCDWWTRGPCRLRTAGPASKPWEQPQILSNTIKYHQIPSATLIGSGLGFWWIIYDKASLALSIFLLWTFGFSACGHLLLGICARGRSLAKDLEDPIHQSHVDLCRSGARPDPSHHQPPSATISHHQPPMFPIHPYPSLCVPWSTREAMWFSMPNPS